MKLYYLNDETGEYCKAGKKEILAAAKEVARLQHLSPVISSASALVDYFKIQMMLLPTEQFRVIYVDNSNRIIKDEILSDGVEDQTAVYPRKVARQMLLNYATGVIVVHNHPTGQLNPSNADIQITKRLVTAVEAIDGRFIDHVIIGSERVGYFSFRENGMI